MNTKINKYKEDAIKHMIDDIKYLEKSGIEADEIWEGIDIQNYSYYCTEEDKIKAFEKAGYTVEMEKI